MRDKLNNDPRFQIGAVVLLVVAALLFFVVKPVGGGEEEEEPIATEATVTNAVTGETATATGATPGEAVEGAVEGVTAPPTASAAAVVPSSIAVPRPPKAVMSAYRANQTVALLVVRDEAVTDKAVKRAASVLGSMPDVAYFVVPASQISRYAAITLGAEVSRVPALVAITPRKLSKGGMEASVTYGYQTRQTLTQAVRDASYRGPADKYEPN